jgi:hypothetical protein
VGLSDGVIDIEDIHLRWSQVSPLLDERGRRLFAANEALAQGYGGVTATAMATGIARSSINLASVSCALAATIWPTGSAVRAAGATVQSPIIRGCPRHWKS